MGTSGSRSAGVEAEESPRYPAWRFVLGVFAASRLFYLLAGVLLAGVSPFGRAAPIGAGARWNIWAAWDGVYLTDIAADGYTSPSAGALPGSSPSIRS